MQGWWSNKTKLSYNTTTNCFIDYFNNKTMGPFAIAGQFSLQPVCFLFQNGNLNMKYNLVLNNTFYSVILEDITFRVLRKVVFLWIFPFVVSPIYIKC